MSTRIEALGDSTLLLHFGECIDAALNAHAVAVATRLRIACLHGVLDVAPAYASVCVRYEPLAWGSTGANAFHLLAARIREIIDAETPIHPTDAGVIEIPVAYGGDSGPDLESVARHAGLPVADVIARHAGVEYRVAMLGFMPGFAYLLGLDAALHMPRRATPRTRVPAGSVAIGGAQTGIYPRESPGGWHLIGRTTARLFDAARDPPALLAPGTRVRFVAQ